MTDSPLRLMLRRSVTLGMFVSAISIGVVMDCFTSYAPNDGACVITCTRLLVMSGVESNGNCDNDHPPQMMRATVSMPIVSLFSIENLISF